jgi:hypothetical protein
MNPAVDAASVRAAKSSASERYLRRSLDTAFTARSAMNPVGGPSPSQNIVAVGRGEKVTNGIATGVAAVKIFVRVKYPKGDIGDDDRIPDMIEGVPVDVEQIGTVRAFRSEAQAATPNPRVKLRPAQPGCSIGFLSPQFAMAGTFGAVVKKGQKQFILSNNHVLANENALPIGSAIVQPGPLDGGKKTDNIAALTKFVQLQAGAMNRVDAAIAAVNSAGLVKREILGIGAPTGTRAATIDMVVHKFGRTTSYRVGRVVSIDTDVKVGYEIGELLFEDQVIIRGINGEQFSAAGDSGSLILERESNRAVALLFAGSSSHTIGNHIADVLTALGVTLA